MENNNLSPIEKILQRKKNEKSLTNEIYKKIFETGVEKTAEIFCVKPHEVIKLIIPIVRKNEKLDEFYALIEKQKLFSICEYMEELQTVSIEKILERCKNTIKEWEILIAKEFLKQKTKREYCD
jgi:hypothetical protein